MNNMAQIMRLIIFNYMRTGRSKCKTESNVMPPQKGYILRVLFTQLTISITTVTIMLTLLAC